LSDRFKQVGRGLGRVRDADIQLRSYRRSKPACRLPRRRLLPSVGSANASEHS
jgi:hypothetical protein